MTYPSADRQASDPLLGEAERIRAMVMNIHALLRGTDAAHLVDPSIETIHRALDRIEEAAGHRPASPHAPAA